MSFYIRKSLAHGPIRFAVGPRAAADEIDTDTALSTGPAGEFLRRRTKAFFVATMRTMSAAELPATPTASSAPFFKALFDGSRRGYLFLVSMIAGVILILVGFAVVINKGSQGWIEVILGLAMIVTPIVLTAQTRRKLREQEERERKEREETERRHRAMLASYAAALERLRKEPNDDALEAVELERERLELPYDLWCTHARRTVLQIGFDALARAGTARAKEVDRLMTRASNAVGLTPADELGVKLDLYRVILWHLLADDRCGDAQLAALKDFRKGFDIWDRDVPVEAQAADEFKKLRGFKPPDLPREECGIALGFHEYCIHVAKGSVLRTIKEKVGGQRVGKLVPHEPCVVYVTNKRLVIDAKRRTEVPLPKIDDVEVDIDPNVLSIRTARGIRTMNVQLEDPIYTGAMISLATCLDERPRGFA